MVGMNVATVEPVEPPSIFAVKAARERLNGLIVKTPVLHWHGVELLSFLGLETRVSAKAELLQYGGSFKLRGALTVALSQPREKLRQGLTTFSSGNHAIAVAFAARALGVPAKVVMPKTANRLKHDICRRYGAEVSFAKNGEEAGRISMEIAERENKVFIHPWEGPNTTLGASTLALELNEQVPDLDAVVVAIGGGGLCSGLAPTIKSLKPQCKVFAVEPEGAPTMFNSFKSGKPETLDRIDTIADALAPPETLPYSFQLCRSFVDELVLVSDQELRVAMNLIYRDLKFAVEPACAAATAGLIGPLKERLRRKRIAVMLCGSNIDPQAFAAHIAGCPDLPFLPDKPI